MKYNDHDIGIQKCINSLHACSPKIKKNRPTEAEGTKEKKTEEGPTSPHSTPTTILISATIHNRPQWTTAKPKTAAENQKTTIATIILTAIQVKEDHGTRKTQTLAKTLPIKGKSTTNS